MAAPSYTEDLTDVTLAETTTGWSAYGGGASGLSASPDLAMQGTNCVDKQITNADKGQYFDNGSGITLGAGDHVYVWHFCGTPGLTDTLANKGASVLIGTSGTAYCQYHVEGNNTYGAGGRVAKCYPIDYSVRSSNTGSIPYRTVTGSPGANPQVFGGGLVTTGTVKGANVGIDAIRYGTGAYITAGDSGDPATFDGFATQNDSSSNRWGILTNVAGSYELQGRFVIGQNNSGTPTLAYFDDNNKNIIIPDNVHAASDFTQIIFDHASTIVIWTNINVTALGTQNPGRIVCNDTSTDVTITGGTYTGIGITTGRAACSWTGTTWRSCGQITLNNATLTSCTIETSTASTALVTADLDIIDDCHFIGDGTGHAVELTSIGGGAMDWNNTFDTSTYATGDGSTGNETIYVNVGSGSLTINVGVGYTKPTIRTAGATVTVVDNPVSTTFTVKSLTTGSNIENALVWLIPTNNSADLPYQESVTIIRAASIATVTHTGHGFIAGQKVWIQGATQPEYNGVHTINIATATTYTYTVSGSPASPATGSPIATAVIFQDLTNGSGQVSDSRVLSVPQPVTGWIRKATGSPRYKQTAISATISNVNGLAQTFQMIDDE